MSNIERDEYMCCPKCGRKTAAPIDTAVRGVKVCTGCRTEYTYSRTLRLVYDTGVF